jgi:hypothetical protein
MDIKKVGSEFTVAAARNEKKVSSGKMGFKEMLQAVRSTQTEITPKTDGVPDSGKTEEVFSQSIMPLSLLQLQPSARSSGIQAAEKALDLLEKYQKKISDSQIPLNKIDGLIESLSKEIQGLKDFSGKVPSSDPLQKILNEIGIVSTVEIEKFNRGDYL